MIEVMSNRVRYRVREERILYIVSDKNGSVMKTLHGEFPSTSSLIYWEEQLDPRFFVRSHESALVHVRYIREMKKDTVTLVDGSVCPMSRRMKRNVKNALLALEKEAENVENS